MTVQQMRDPELISPALVGRVFETVCGQFVETVSKSVSGEFPEVVSEEFSEAVSGGCVVTVTLKSTKNQGTGWRIECRERWRSKGDRVENNKMRDKMWKPNNLMNSNDSLTCTTHWGWIRIEGFTIELCAWEALLLYTRFELQIC